MVLELKPQLLIRGDLERTHFCATGNEFIKRIDTDFNIEIPDMTGVTTLEEFEQRALMPFTNDRGETLPWMVAFMEAARVVVAGSQAFGDGSKGRNDFCPLYAGVERDLLRYLGFDCTPITFKNGGFYPEEIKQVFAQVIAMGGDVLPPSRIVQVAVFLSDHRALLDKWRFSELLKKVLSPSELERLSPEDVIKLKQIHQYVRSSYVLSIMKQGDKELTTQIGVAKLHSEHIATVFLIRGTLYLLDINQDQNQHPLLNKMADYDERNGWLRKYGINPLRDAPFIATLDEGLQRGYYYGQSIGERTESEIRAKCSSNIDKYSQTILKRIFQLMKEGTMIWDEEKGDLSDLRSASTALIRARRTLIGK